MKNKAPINWTKHLLPGHPIVYITTISSRGVDNCAVFATCIDTSYNPPQITFASAIKQHKVVDSENVKNIESIVQDTLKNIQENGRFIVNVPGINLIDSMKILAYPYPSNVDEIDKAKLTKLNPFYFSLDKPYPKLVGECLAHLECELAHGGVYYPNGSDHYLVTGNVLGASYDSQLGSELDKIRKNLIERVFYQLGASSKPNSRYIGRMVVCELEKTLIFESERK